MLFFSTKRKNSKRAPEEDASVSGYDSESCTHVAIVIPACGALVFAACMHAVYV